MKALKSSSIIMNHKWGQKIKNSGKGGALEDFALALSHPHQPRRGIGHFPNPNHHPTPHPCHPHFTQTNRRVHSDSTPSRNTEHTRQLRVFGNERTTGRTPRDPLPQKLYSPNSFRRSSMQMPFPRLKSRISPCLPASPSSLRPLPPFPPSIHSPLFCFHFLLFVFIFFKKKKQ
jgi:hypothetical protein